MMSSSTNDKYNQGSGKISVSKVAQVEANNDSDDQRMCKTTHIITNLPEDCLSFIFMCLKTDDDRNSFGLTCHQLLDIQNKNCRELWYSNRKRQARPSLGENFPIVLCKLLIRFQHLEYLSLRQRPQITDYVVSKSQFFGSEVRILDLEYCSRYSNSELSSIFSWCPRLIDVSLKYSQITDEGLEALAKFCASLETVDLSWCDLITDSGISFLMQNCRELDSLNINFCSNVTGIGFLGCPHSLTYLKANGCRLTLEGIRAIVSGGGLEWLQLATPNELSEVGQGSMNIEAVLTVLKGCPLLEYLAISNFVEAIKPEGWEAIRRNCKNCKNLTSLRLYACSHKLGYLVWKALMDGCDKLCLTDVTSSV